MVVIILPDFVTELEEKLDKVIKDISIKNKIDMIAIDDSKAIEDGKNLISNALVRIYWNYGIEDRKRFIEDRKRLEDFEKEMEKSKIKNEVKKVRRSFSEKEKRITKKFNKKGLGRSYGY